MTSLGSSSTQKMMPSPPETTTQNMQYHQLAALSSRPLLAPPPQTFTPSILSNQEDNNLSMHGQCIAPGAQQKKLSQQISTTRFVYQRSLADGRLREILGSNTDPQQTRSVVASFEATSRGHVNRWEIACRRTTARDLPGFAG